MGNYRFAERPLDPDAVAAADAAVGPYTGGRPLRMDETDLRAKWMDAYEAAGGRVGTIEMDDSKPDDTCESCPKNKRLVVDLVQMEVLSDHNLLKDDDSDYKNSGKLYKPPDWTPTTSNPISHSQGKKIKIKLVVQAARQGSSEQGRLIGRFNGKLLFDSKKIEFKPGAKKELTLETKFKLRPKVRKLTIDIEWFVATKKSYVNWTSLGFTDNVWYITVDKPRDEGKPEDGVTLQRMDKAVELVEPIGSIKPHDIVAALMGKFDGYTLERNPAVPKECRHPKYLPGYLDPKDKTSWVDPYKLGGAWLAADYINYGAECQAIVRFVRGVIFQLGCPGEARTVVIWSDPDVNAGNTTLEADWGKGGLGGKPSKKVGAEYWFASLADKPVYEDSYADGVGLNNFEACLKFAADKKTLYYGGGVQGAYESKEQIIQAFFAVAWFTTELQPSGATRDICRKVVKKHRPY